MYLQHSGAEDPEQYKKAKIPTEITFQIKPQIALEQIKTAKAGDGVAINLPWSMIVQRTSAMFRVPCS
ncbi:hypothetical protein [Mesorhizobium sp. B2-6-1]|uniref:hypothetical protein n=1 Tax=Mesorhizobium sp. B2-6-1 TaxID=2589916 RepID=UPI002484B409|nr:hypothetical protein [Mesorhizobium sp. B2-6-1]